MVSIMRGKIALLISLLVTVSFISGCTTSEVFVNNNEFYGCIQEPVIMDEDEQNRLNALYTGYLEDCRQECSTCNCEADAKIVTFMDYVPDPLGSGYWEPGLLGKEVTLPFNYGINRCSPLPKNPFYSDLGIDINKCSEFLTMTPFNPITYPFALFLQSYFLEFINLEGSDLEDSPMENEGCIPNPSGLYNPPSKCQLKESYLLVLNSNSSEPINVNGHQIIPMGGEGGFMSIVYFYSGWDKNLIDEFILEGPFASENIYAYNQIPSSINISRNQGEDIKVFLYRECCWDCNPKPSLPATILYPKVDIESFTLNNGDAIIKDGKIVSSFTIAPGVQKPTIGVENRGFFTQNNVYIKFVGLPDGIEVSTAPELQKIKAHNIGTYETTFTVGPNVPSGTYKISLIAYSPNGILDTIIMDLVVL